MSFAILIALVSAMCAPLDEGRQDELFEDLAVAIGPPAEAGALLRYRLLRPARIEPGVTYPLVLFLHGAGERGSDNRKQLAYLPRLMARAENRTRYPCFLLAPQCRAGKRWVEVDWSQRRSQPMGPPAEMMRGVIAALHRTLAENPIDRRRIYLTGLSMGGFGAWDLAARHPEWFAAVAPICGGGDERAAHRLVGLPLWAFHGAADRTVAPERSRAMIRALVEAGGQPLYSELEGVGHAVWKPAYEDPDGLLPWLFEQVKPAGKSRR